MALDATRTAAILTILGTQRGASSINTVNDVLAAVGLPEVTREDLRGMSADVRRDAYDCYYLVKPGVRVSAATAIGRLTELSELTDRGFGVWRLRRGALWTRWINEDAARVTKKARVKLLILADGRVAPE